MAAFRGKFLPELLTLIILMAVGFLMYRQGVYDSLDVRMFYSAEEARSYLQSLESEKARRYLQKEYLDMFYLILYSILFFLLMKRFFPQSVVLRYCAFAPGLFDAMETSWIIYLLSTQDLEGNLGALGFISGTKWILAYILLGLVFVGLGKVLWQRTKTQAG